MALLDRLVTLASVRQFEIRIDSKVQGIFGSGTRCTALISDGICMSVPVEDCAMHLATMHDVCGSRHLPRTVENAWNGLDIDISRPVKVAW
jgi:hypothetical protein